MPSDEHLYKFKRPTQATVLFPFSAIESAPRDPISAKCCPLPVGDDFEVRRKITRRSIAQEQSSARTAFASNILNSTRILKLARVTADLGLELTVRIFADRVLELHPFGRYEIGAPYCYGNRKRIQG